MTDFIDYCFGGGALSLVASRSVYTGKLHRNQGDPYIDEGGRALFVSHGLSYCPWKMKEIVRMSGIPTRLLVQLSVGFLIVSLLAVQRR
ncbi:hypothetical protein [Burkholderia cepacia]|uniref:hypothetical protein n=1 Tax=Burkholderia cepacia TaxID=292 RepID=UPI001E306054|nr:hypothetical protein [Burkholderia cepacia]